MAYLRLFWLGPPAIELDDHPLRLEMRKNLALLAYLSLSPHNPTRETLASLFWPEYDQQHAMANLRRSLSSLGKSLPDGLLEADRDVIGLRRVDWLKIDVDDFNQELSYANQHTHPADAICPECLAHLEKAVALYRGNFFEGFSLKNCPEFDEWQYFQREGLQSKYATVMEKLAAHNASQSQWDQAILHARSWLALDRLYEPACRALMDLYARSGQRSAALRQYEELAHLLKDQLDQEPEEETRQLYEKIRGQKEAKQGAESPERPSSFPLLKTKLYIPTAPISRLTRSHLIARLGEMEKKALTIVSAPAGFGKTTLLVEWIAQTSLPVAWLSLDNGDNDPYRFISYLISALESIHEGIGIEARQIMQSPQLVSVLIILASLINDLEKVSEPCVLILDDYQFIREHAVHETLSYLLDHIPSNIHLVISTRADPPLQLGRLRAHDQMLELRMQDLRFTLQEATEFLNEVMRLGLSAEDIETLEMRTEGWVVGLKMAALSIQGRNDVSEFISAFSGSHRYVLDYLVEEILRRQPTHIQTFLLETSILEKLSGPLCDALMSDEWKQAGESGQAVLENLDRNNLFLIPLDDDKVWFRYHHLFADTLRSRLQQLSAKRLIILHSKASYWYETQGLILDAIEHAMSVKDFERASGLVEHMVHYSIAGTDYATIQTWIDKIPEDLLSSHPWVCLAQAYLSIACGEIKKLEVWVQKAESALCKFHEEDSPHLTELRDHLQLMHAYIAFFHGDILAAIRHGAPLLETRHEMSPSLRSQVDQAVGEFHMSAGEYEKAKPLLLEAIILGSRTHNLVASTVSSFRLGILLKTQGRLVEAEKLHRENIRMLIESGLRDSSLLGRAETGLGDILREKGKLIEARKLLQDGLRHSQLQRQPYDLVFAYTYLSRLEYGLGNIKRAWDLLEEAGELFNSFIMPPSIQWYWEYYFIPVCIARDDWKSIENWMIKRKINLVDPVNYENELTLMAYTRVLVSRNQLVEAFELLTKMSQEVERAGRYGRLIEVINLLALILHAQGNTIQALDFLNKSLILAEPEEYERIFLDEGEPMHILLKLYKDKLVAENKKIQPQPNEQVGYVDRLLSSFESE